MTSTKRTVAGYLHNVSPMKKAKSSQAQFFTATLQQNDQYKKVVVFSPQKHADMKNYEEAEETVEISNYSVGSSSDILVYPQAEIKSVAKSSTAPQYIPPSLMITDIGAIKEDIIGKLQTVKIHVLKIGDPKEVKPGLTKADCIVSDQSGTMKLVIWNQDLDKVKESTSYTIEGVNVKDFQGNLYLTTTKGRTIKSIPADQQVTTHMDSNNFQLPEEPAPAPVLVNNIIGVMKIDKMRICNVCRKTTTDKSNPMLVYCASCKMTRLTNKCELQLYASIQLDKVHHVVNFFTEHLQLLRDNYATSEEIPLIVTNMSNEQVEVMLLSQPPLAISLKHKSLTSLKIVDL